MGQNNTYARLLKGFAIFCFCLSVSSLTQAFSPFSSRSRSSSRSNKSQWPQSNKLQSPSSYSRPPSRSNSLLLPSSSSQPPKSQSPSSSQPPKSQSPSSSQPPKSQSPSSSSQSPSSSSQSPSSSSQSPSSSSQSPSSSSISSYIFETYCPPKMDVVVVLDASTSIGDLRWVREVLPFARKFVEVLHVSSDGAHTAFIVYNAVVHEKWTFSYETYWSEPKLLAGIDKLKTEKVRGTTYTGAAMESAVNLLSHGAGVRSDAAKLIVVVTDGKSTDNTKQATLHAKSEGIKVIVVGVGDTLEEDFKAIVGCEHDADCPQFVKTNWSELLDEVNKVFERTCIAAVDEICNFEWRDLSTCSNNCGKGIKHQARYYKVGPKKQYDTKMALFCKNQRNVPFAQECVETICPDATCGDFGLWSCCSMRCGNIGQKVRVRRIWNFPPAKRFGRTCEQQNLKRADVAVCFVQTCPLNAIPGDWENWSHCSARCGPGQRIRTRKPEKRRAMYGGYTLHQLNIPLQQSEDCQIAPCGR